MNTKCDFCVTAPTIRMAENEVGVFESIKLIIVSREKVVVDVDREKYNTSLTYYCSLILESSKR